MQRKFRASLRDLCTYLEHDLTWADVNALRAEAPLPLRPLARQQRERVAKRHGFEAIDTDHPPRTRIKLFAEDMLLWGSRAPTTRLP